MVFHLAYEDAEAFDVVKVSYGCHIEKNVMWSPCVICGELTPWIEIASNYNTCSTRCITELYETYVGTYQREGGGQHDSN